MKLDDIKKLRALTNFPALVAYLYDELDWPIEVEDADEVAFDYDAAELGIDPKHAVKIETIKQVRPLEDNQPWGIFYIEFESKRLPVVVLRRILRALVPKRRGDPDRPVWAMDDLLFISAFGDEASGRREIAFAHFHQETGDLPTLRVLGWDGADTPLKLDHVAATLKERLRWPTDPDDADAWREQWTPAFRHRLRHVIRTSNALAERLALLARGIRDAATTLMEHETERGPLRRLHKAFQTALIHDLTEADFADTYAQTITYGLLTAAISRTEMSEGRYGTALVAGNVTDMVPITNPFLREMLQTFIQAGGRRGGIDFDELGIQDVVDLLRGDETDLPAILRDFGNRTRGEDPVIHFYEHFLAAYDKQLKIKRGIFYTPQPVVSYIVRSAHELLQTEFGLEDGLASTVTWGEMAGRTPGLKIPDGTDPQSPFVVILDPATGTATFIVEVIDVVHRTMTAKWTRQGLNEAQRQAAWNEYVPRHLLPRLYGYELMMAPYAIAHMKIGLKLYETGYRFGSDERVRVYLTNALEPASDEGAQLVFTEWAPALAHEAQAVNAIKRRQRFTVVIGNPPYSKMSGNLSEAAVSLIEPFRYVDGVRIVEKGALAHELNLQDDYVKFFGLLARLLATSQIGIASYISNFGFLRSRSLRGMRKTLLDSFAQLRFLNLGGHVADRAVSLSTDQNVFDISQGVCISVLSAPPAGNARVCEYKRLAGTRATKYLQLASGTISLHTTERLLPTAPFYKFIPSNAQADQEFAAWYDLGSIMPRNSCCIITSRDSLLIDFDGESLLEKIGRFASLPAGDQSLEQELGYSVKAKWDVEKSKRLLRSDGVRKDRLRKIIYRPFDERLIYYEPHLIDAPARPVYAAIHETVNLVLMTPHVKTTASFNHAFVSRYAGEKKSASHDRSTQMFPLWDSAGIDGQRPPNISHRFQDHLQRVMSTPVAPEHLFHYIYAILHSPSYRELYGDALRDSFPRIPVPGRPTLISELLTKGADLVALHLLEDDYPAASWNVGRIANSPLQNPITTFVEGVNGATMGAFSKSKCYEGGRVYLDTSQLPHSSYFDGVPENVWNFHIGGYQVCRKWLYDRRGKSGQPGRTLTPDDIAHYQRIVVALKETIRLMEETDEVIEAYGGWPIG